LWFFFAGHGISTQDNSEDYLLPRDGKHRYPEKTAISISYVTNCLRKCNAQNIVLVLDMCRENRVESNSRGVIGSATAQITRKKGRDKQSIVTIFSCSPEQSSYEIPALTHEVFESQPSSEQEPGAGVFTYTLLRGLQRCTTLGDLEIYLRDTVPEVNQEHGKPRQQVPWVVLEPGWIRDVPLLPECATGANINELMLKAQNAENEEKFDKAKKLWWIVIHAQESTEQIRRDAERAIERINKKIRWMWMRRGLAAVVASSLVGMGALVVNVVRTPPVDAPPSSPPLSSSPPEPAPTPLPLTDEYFSRGEEVLLNKEPPPKCDDDLISRAFDSKRTGAEAFRRAFRNSESAARQEGYRVAKELFADANRQFIAARYNQTPACPGGDPETLIYLNNTIALSSGKPVLTIAVGVPGNNPDNYPIAESILRGVAQVQAQVNGNGEDKIGDEINGHLLQVLIAGDDSFNDTSDPNIAERVATHLVNNDILGDGQFKAESGEILGVIGHYTSDATLAAGKVYEGTLPAIAPTSTAVRTTTEPDPSQPFAYQFDLSQWVFRTASSDAIAASDLVQTLSPGEKAVIVYNSPSIYSKSLSQAFAEALKNDRNGEVADRCDMSQENCAARVPAQLKENQATVLMLVPSSTTNLMPIVQTINALEASQVDRTTLLGGDVVHDQILLEKLGSKVIGRIFIGVPWHRAKATEPWLASFQTLWGTTFGDWTTATSYDAAQALIEGLRMVVRPDVRPDRRALYQALTQVEAQGATGIVKFDPTSHDRLVDVEGQRTVGTVVEVIDGSCPPSQEILIQFCPVEPSGG
jgi:ABC-type branched-subunit amino acid transport system substrate-binding protein